MRPKKQRILICPLDWGLGHATRCIPIISALIDAGAEPIIAADGDQLELLKIDFPQLTTLRFPGYRIGYSKNIPAAIFLISRLPRLFSAIRSEHRELKKIVEELKIETIISDNRYGLWHNQIPSVLITHQLFIRTPKFLRLFEPMIHAATRRLIQRFPTCWIPDFENEPTLSGELSHGSKAPANIRYIGPLSRFERTKEGDNDDNPYDVLVLISGPEPQRSIFEEIVLKQLPRPGKRCLVLRGKPGNQAIHQKEPGLDIADHLPAPRLGALLRQKPLVISRPGYSTLMDIAVTGNRAILVPTPGQTEQEYLAKNLENQGFFIIRKQHSLNLAEAIEKAMLQPVPEIKQNNQLLNDAIFQLIHS